jgi:hypothetical protein
MLGHFQFKWWVLYTECATLMFRRHVRSVRGFSPYTTVCQSALTGGPEEPICQRTNTNLSTLYLFLSCTRPPDFDTHRTPRPESHVRYSQMKTYCSDRIWGRRKGQHHRRWENQCWLNNHRNLSSYVTVQHVTGLNGKIVVCRGFQQDLSSTSNNNYFRLACHRRITTPMFKITSTGVIPPSRSKRVSISSLLHRYVEIYINKTTSSS